MKISTLNFVQSIFNFSPVVDISSIVADISSTVADSLTVTDTFTSVIILGYNKLKSFHIQSYCMMSVYHITEYNQLIKNIVKIT